MQWWGFLMSSFLINGLGRWYLSFWEVLSHFCRNSCSSLYSPCRSLLILPSLSFFHCLSFAVYLSLSISITVYICHCLPFTDILSLWCCFEWLKFLFQIKCAFNIYPQIIVLLFSKKIFSHISKYQTIF